MHFFPHFLQMLIFAAEWTLPKWRKMYLAGYQVAHKIAVRHSHKPKTDSHLLCCCHHFFSVRSFVFLIVCVVRLQVVNAEFLISTNSIHSGPLIVTSRRVMYAAEAFHAYRTNLWGHRTQNAPVTLGTFVVPRLLYFS